MKLEDAVQQMLVSAGIACRVTYYLCERTDGLVEIDGTSLQVQVGHDNSVCIMEDRGCYDIRALELNVDVLRLVERVRAAMRFVDERQRRDFERLSSRFLRQPR